MTATPGLDVAAPRVTEAPAAGGYGRSAQAAGTAFAEAATASASAGTASAQAASRLDERLGGMLRDRLHAMDLVDQDGRLRDPAPVVRYERWWAETLRLLERQGSAPRPGAWIAVDGATAGLAELDDDERARIAPAAAVLAELPAILAAGARPWT